LFNLGLPLRLKVEGSSNQFINQLFSNCPVFPGLMNKLKHQPGVVVHFRLLSAYFLRGLRIVFVDIFHLISFG
jgi:hypothetical protein